MLFEDFARWCTQAVSDLTQGAGKCLGRRAFQPLRRAFREHQPRLLASRPDMRHRFEALCTFYHAGPHHSHARRCRGFVEQPGVALAAGMLGGGMALMLMHIGGRFTCHAHCRSPAQHVQPERAAAPTLAVQTMAGIQRWQLLRVDLDDDAPASALTGESHTYTPYNDVPKSSGRMIPLREPGQKNKKGATVGQECMSGLEWESQRVFLAVLRSGSLSGAAKLLGIAQATARRRLDYLEQALGLSLFTRTSTGLTPTSGAQRLIEHAEAMDLAARAFNRMASAETSVDQGSVRLTCGELLGVEVLPGLLRNFHHSHPGLKLELSIGDALEDIARLQSDIAVRLMRPVEADIAVRRVGSLQVGIHASAECLQRYGTPASMALLRQQPLIGPDRRSADLRRLVDVGLCDADQHFAIVSDNHLAQLAALKAGLGFGLCPTRIARDHGLIQVLPDSFGFEVDVWIAIHRDLRKVKRIVRAFEVLGEELHDYLREADH